MRQAIAVCQAIKSEFPSVQVVWGGYFPTMYADVAIAAQYVDFLFRGHSEIPFLAFVDALLSGSNRRNQAGLSWCDADSGHLIMVHSLGNRPRGHCTATEARCRFQLRESP